MNIYLNIIPLFSLIHSGTHEDAMEGGSKKMSPAQDQFPQWKLAAGCVVLGAHASVSMAAHSCNTVHQVGHTRMFHTHLGFTVLCLTAL